MMISDFDTLLAGSQATDAFRTDLTAFIARQPADRITASTGSPRIKVLRAIAQLLHAEPSLSVDRVTVRGASGCADFTGAMTVVDATGESTGYEFVWDCEWKANQLGYVDGFGFPDQIRAAQEFGWQCFQRWNRLTMPVARVG